MHWERVGWTLGEVLRKVAQEHPHRVAMIGFDRQWTWSELDEAVDALACQWEAAGLRPGQAVAFLMAKRPEVVIGFLACARIGAMQTPINFKLPMPQVQDLVATAKVAALFVDQAHAALAADILVPGPTFTVEGDGPLSISRSMDYKGCRSSHIATPDDVCYLNYTSGSTGRPKGARTTHRNILVNAAATIDGLGFTAEDVYLGMFSVFAHPHELFHRSLLLAGTFVVVDSLSPRVIAEVVQRYRVSWMMAVPSFYEMLREGRAELGSLRVLESGGAYVSPETLARMESAFAARFLPVWGSTETTGVALGMRIDQPARPGSTGRPIDSYSVSLRNEAGEEVAVGEVGELFVRGEAVATGGYEGQPEETAACFVDGWYATRDLMRRDADGYYYFIGRRSEMLKIGGIRVFPLQIEEAIKLHPEVRDTVVVRAEERLRGEVARAVVSTVPGSTLGVAEIQRWCRSQLALYMVPRIVEFWKEVPKLPNGKIDKKAVLAVPPDPHRDERT